MIKMSYSVKKLVGSIFRKIKFYLLTPSLPEQKLVDLLVLGSEYGGKNLALVGDLSGSTLLSGGCGEDISFDIEYAAKFDAKVILIDPIPKSIEHVEKVFTRIGKPASAKYSKTGCQQTEAYDMSRISPGQIKFIPNALWSVNTKLKLFPPKNLDHVSYSFLDLQGVKKNSSGMEVDTITISEIVEMIQPTEITVLKLDIEGAQLEVLQHCFAIGVKPSQIIVEIDELFFPTIRGRRRARTLLKLLKDNGYELVARMHKFDLTFVKGSLLE